MTDLSKIILKLFFVVIAVVVFTFEWFPYLIGLWNQFLFRGVTLQLADPW